MILIVIAQIVEYRVECPFDYTDNLTEKQLKDFAESIINVYRTLCFDPITYRYDNQTATQ